MKKIVMTVMFFMIFATSVSCGGGSNLLIKKAQADDKGSHSGKVNPIYVGNWSGITYSSSSVDSFINNNIVMSINADGTYSCSGDGESLIVTNNDICSKPISWEEISSNGLKFNYTRLNGKEVFVVLLVQKISDSQLEFIQGTYDGSIVLNCAYKN